MEQRDMQQMNVGRELSALERLTVKQFRERYAEVFGETSRPAAWLHELPKGLPSGSARRCPMCRVALTIVGMAGSGHSTSPSNTMASESVRSPGGPPSGLTINSDSVSKKQIRCR